LSGGKKYWIGFGIGAGLLALFFVTGDWLRLGDALAQANYWYILPAIVLYQLSVVLRTMRWQVLLRHMRHIPVSRLYPIVVVGYMANNLLPMRIGELVRSYYLSEREQVSKTSALVTIVIERLLDALTLLVFIAVIAIFVPLLAVAEGFGESSRVPWQALVAGASVPFFLAFGGLMLAAHRPARAAALGGALLTPLPRAIGERLRPLIDLVIQGLAALGNPWTVLGMFLLSVPLWLLEAGLFMVLGYSFGLESAYDGLFEMAVAMILVTAIANIGSSVPAAPGGIGLFELVARETLVLLPLAVIDRATATAYVTVVHAVLLLPMIVLGQVFMLSGSDSLRGLWRAGRSLSDETEPARQDTGDVEAPL
jgi:uncharacterized protein (TIRG00374 family)